MFGSLRQRRSSQPIPHCLHVVVRQYPFLQYTLQRASESTEFGLGPARGHDYVVGRKTDSVAYACSTCTTTAYSQTDDGHSVLMRKSIVLTFDSDHSVSIYELNPSAKSRRNWRIVSWVGTLMFHLTNARLFTIGAFPFTMIASNALFVMDCTHSTDVPTIATTALDSEVDGKPQHM